MKLIKKGFFFLLVLILGTPFQMTAHEDPAKTKKEKEAKEAKRQKIIINKIALVTIWRIETKKNTDSDNRKKYAEVFYNKNGCAEQINVFNDKDSLSEKTIMAYDFENKLILDYDIEGNTNKGEKTIFQYNSEGLIEKIFDFDKENHISSMAEYTYDKKAKHIIYTKYKSLNNVEYTLRYLYDSNIGNGNCIEIEKNDSAGKLIMKVINKFDKNGMRSEKAIYNDQNELNYKFLYTYTDTKDFSVITKISQTGERLSSDEYFYNDNGTLKKIISKDKDENIDEVLEYTYE